LQIEHEYTKYNTAVIRTQQTENKCTRLDTT